MKAISGSIRLSASDLSNHLACHHLTSLDLAVALGARSAPALGIPLMPSVLQERGMAHEDAYLAHLEAQGVSVLNLRDIEDSERAWRKPELRWKVALRQLPRQRWQTGNGSGARTCFGESRGLASSAAGLTKCTIASSPARQRPQRSFSCRSIPSSWRAFREFIQSQCTWSRPEWIFSRRNTGAGFRRILSFRQSASGESD